MTFDTLNKVYIVPTDDTEESMEFLKKMIAKIKPRYLFTHLLRKEKVAYTRQFTRDLIEYAFISPYDIKYNTDNVVKVRNDKYCEKYLWLLDLCCKYYTGIYPYLFTDVPFKYNKEAGIVSNSSRFSNYETKLYTLFRAMMGRYIQGPIIITIDAIHLRTVMSYRYPGVPKIPNLLVGKYQTKNRLGTPVLLNAEVIQRLDKSLRIDNYYLEANHGAGLALFGRKKTLMARENVATREEVEGGEENGSI